MQPIENRSAESRFSFAVGRFLTIAFICTLNGIEYHGQLLIDTGIDDTEIGFDQTTASFDLLILDHLDIVGAIRSNLFGKFVEHIDITWIDPQSNPILTIYQFQRPASDIECQFWAGVQFHV